MLGIVLRKIVDGELTVGKVLRGPHDGGEELLLEGEPFELVVKALGSLAAVADTLRLLLVREVVVQAGGLALVLEALLHPRDDRIEIHVDAAHVARDQIFHADEGKRLVHRVGILHERVGLLDIAAVRERQAHHHGRVRGGLGHIQEVELPGIHGRRGIHDKSELALAVAEDIQIRLVVILVFLDPDRIGLGTHRSEGDLQFFVLQLDQASLALRRSVQEGIAVNRRLRRQRGHHRVLRVLRQISGPDAVLPVLFHGGDGIQLCLVLHLLPDLTALEPEEAHHDQGDQNEADD